MAINFFFTLFVNSNVKTLGGRLPIHKRLKDVAWLADFLVFHAFVCIFSWADVVQGEKFLTDV